MDQDFSDQDLLAAGQVIASLIFTQHEGESINVTGLRIYDESRAHPHVRIEVSERRFFGWPPTTYENRTRNLFSVVRLLLSLHFAFFLFFLTNC